MSLMDGIERKRKEMKQLFRFVEIWEEKQTFAAREFQQLRTKIEFEDKERKEQDTYTNQLEKLQRQTEEQKEKHSKASKEISLIKSRWRKAEKDHKESISKKDE